MTNDEFNFEETPFDPASMATSSLGIAKAVWYKRPWILIVIAVVVVVAISIITDLPRPITKAQDAATQNGTIKQINVDTKACSFAVNESFQFYNKFAQGKLTPSELTQTSGLLVGDQTACSFASEPVYDLTNNIQPLRTSAGKHIDEYLSVASKWMTDYALASIEDIQYLFSKPGTSSKIQGLTSLETHLSAERALAFKDVNEAQQILGIPLKSPILPVLPHLTGT
ncbi:MAG TPA: hypothetical protein VIJ40_07125 [Acidimicrobiales bacterium]